MTRIRTNSMKRANRSTSAKICGNVMDESRFVLLMVSRISYICYRTYARYRSG